VVRFTVGDDYVIEASGGLFIENRIQWLDKWRIAARRGLKLGAASSHVAASIQVATYTGGAATIDGTPPAAHQPQNSSAARA
jgi:hypothetical protein